MSMSLRQSYRCRHPSEEEEEEQDPTLSWVEYWQHCGDTKQLDRARGTYAAILAPLEEATGRPATELARESVRRWLIARKWEEQRQYSEYLERMREWYRMYGPRSTTQPNGRFPADRSGNP